MLETLASQLENRHTAALLVATLFALLVVALLMAFLALMRLNKVQRRLMALTAGTEGNLEEVLANNLREVEANTRRMDALEQATGVLQAQIPLCVQKFHLLRYDAFEDVGGHQSFSIALLNAGGDGLLLSGVYNRMDMRVYAKSLQGGRASHPLSQEEERVLRECLAK